MARVGEDAKPGHLGSRAGGGVDGNEGRYCLVGLVSAFIVADVPAVGGHDATPLAQSWELPPPMLPFLDSAISRSHTSIQSGRDWFRVPDVPAILTDCAVRGELAHAGGVKDRHAGPPILVAAGHIDLPLHIDVGGKIGREHEGVMEKKRVDQRFEQFLIAI
jgi:hypothetical protein